MDEKEYAQVLEDLVAEASPKGPGRGGGTAGGNDNGFCLEADQQNTRSSAHRLGGGELEEDGPQ